MGDTQTNSKIVKMKLFAVLALAVASRQVNQYAGTTEIGAECADATKWGDNTECKEPDSLVRADEKCSCLDGFVADTDNISCKEAEAEVITDIGADCNAVGAEKCGENAECKAAPTWLRAAGDVCQCKDTFEPSKDNTKDCVTTIVPPKKIGDKCAAATECGTNASCEKPAAEATRADDTVCTCNGYVANTDGINCDAAPAGDSAALYSVATAFMALILA